MTWATFRDTLQAQVAEQSGLTAIWANQNAPRPAYPYILLQVISTRQTNEIEYQQEYTGFDDLYFIDKVNRHVIATVNIQVLSSSAAQSLASGSMVTDVISGLALKLNRRRVRDTFRASNMALIRCDGINDISESADGQWIWRATMDCDFGFAINYTETPQETDTTLQSIYIGGDFTNADHMDFNNEEFGDLDPPIEPDP